jgi:hypothetical protein
VTCMCAAITLEYAQGADEDEAKALSAAIDAAAPKVVSGMLQARVEPAVRVPPSTHDSGSDDDDANARDRAKPDAEAKKVC